MLAHGLGVSDVDGVTIVEGQTGQPLLQLAGDIDCVVEACFSAQTERALLYAENLSPGFFDLSSGDAGTILQKLRNYGIRLAVVVSADTSFSTRFGEMVGEEKRRHHFGLFDTRDRALEWLHW